MKGFRAFFWLAVVCVIIGAAISQTPGCKPPDMGHCTFNLDTNRYDCPEDK